MAKEGSSDYKKVRKRWFFKEPLTECFFVEPKMVLLWHRLKCERLEKDSEKCIFGTIYCMLYFL